MVKLIFIVLGILIINFILLFIFCALRIASITDYNEFLYTKSLKKW